MTVLGILLAAGNSTRFGSDKRRALLADGKGMLEQSLANLTQAVDEVMIAVKNHEPWLDSLVNDTANIRCLEIPLTQGLGDTLADAIKRAQTSPEVSGVLIALADMPWIKLTTLEMIRNRLTSTTIVVPSHQGKWGHPVGFGRSFFNDLTLCQGDTGAQWLLKQECGKASFVEIEVQDAGVLQDVDEPGQIKK